MENFVKDITVVTGNKKELKKLANNISKQFDTYTFSKDDKTYSTSIDNLMHHAQAWWLDCLKANKRTFKVVIIDCDEPPYIESNAWIHFTGWLSKMNIALLCFTHLPETSFVSPDKTWTPKCLAYEAKQNTTFSCGFQRMSVEELISYINVQEINK